jgi:hypothetical protein
MSRILRGEKPAELSMKGSAAIIGGSLDDMHGRAAKMPEEPLVALLSVAAQPPPSGQKAPIIGEERSLRCTSGSRSHVAVT